MVDNLTASAVSDQPFRDSPLVIHLDGDDQRNTLIVELDGQTHLGARLQGLQNIDLAKVVLGAVPA
jgi:hypothetical protein